jgi:purine-binding chemotaxis protein CheW
MDEHAAYPETITVDQRRTRAENLLQVVSFRVGNEEFGLDILRVHEIIRVQDLTRVPNSPDFVDGVINLRGKVIPVISLRRRFGLQEQAHDKEIRIVVLEIQNMVLGSIVDSVSEVLRLPAHTVAPPPRLGKIGREFVAGVGKLENRLMILLDVGPDHGRPGKRGSRRAGAMKGAGSGPDNRMEEFYQDPALLQAFLVESEELLQAIDQDLVELESEPDSEDLLNRIFRALHTIKGTAGAA